MKSKYKKEIQPRDSKGQYHGYQQWYYSGKLWVRGLYKHGVRIGYRENHSSGVSGLSGLSEYYIR